MPNRLYFGDNLDVMRDHVRDESVDLVYLDPPFNSNATYNVLFKEPSGNAAEAQAEAFRDTWEWGESAANSYEDVRRAGGDVFLALRGLRAWLGENAMMAYVAMMAARILELRRVLKPTGSLYLHCDPKASHYLKIVLDAVFGHESFLNEVIWKRTSSHSSSLRWGPVHDSILYYGKTDSYVWNKQFQIYDEAYLKRFYRFEDERGRYQVDNLTGAGRRGGDSGQPWRKVSPDERGRHWAVPNNLLLEIKPDADLSAMTTQQKLDLLDENGFIAWPKSGEMPRFKRYLKETGGVAIQDIVTDIGAISSHARERLGYPTQKPLALMERIIAASSNEGDVILDPFCGCGTTVEAAEKMRRQWVGIDVTHYAVTLIEARLGANYPDAQFAVLGRPGDMAGARELARRDKHQFQWWAAWRVGAQTYREEKRGADRGIDGNVFFKNGPYGDGRIIISVKGGENVGVQMVRDLRGVIERESAEMGILVTLVEPTGPMLKEALDADFVQKSAHGRLPRLQIATVANLLDGHMPKLPPLPIPERQVARAPRRRERDQMELLLPFPSERVLEEGVTLDPRFRKFG